MRLEARWLHEHCKDIRAINANYNAGMQENLSPDQRKAVHQYQSYLVTQIELDAGAEHNRKTCWVCNDNGKNPHSPFHKQRVRK